MVYAVEELLQIKVYDPVVTLLDVLLRLHHRLMGRSPWSEPVAVLAECGVPPLLQHLQHRLLHESIHHRRDAKLSRASSRLRYLHPLHRLRSISACQKLLLQSRPILPQEVWQFLDRHAVNPCRPCVGFHAPQRFLQVLLLARLLDQLVRVRLTFRAEFRRRGFDPFLGCSGGFTPSLTCEGQLLLDFLSLLHVESLSVLVSRAVRAFRSPTLLCPLLTSGRRSGVLANPSVLIPGHLSDLLG